ncbi:NADH dehydrogenase [ubiquinone] 1 beta subcomplex subunit 1-like [Peromyscus californicus insignis]|uniref:NADH dehydrogenase [ubiquinone] 1 beta subcomplex subunit 1-like n=1 Tax=Peromyscus californicus insignis TaxID=564181 RepID=UPI0022A705CC|nr:NADH dehydrogenase [ubiquinone] 1 beta subcomplex subunit 1-like [Peromyscus californicus insignis]
MKWPNSLPLPLVVGCAWHWAAAIRVTLLQLVHDYWVHLLVPVGFVFGYYLDKRDNEKLTAFWNKRMLLQRELRPDEEVTWK